MSANQMKVTFYTLLALAIGLQLLDGYSTASSIANFNEEKNWLITGLSYLFGVSVTTSVWMCKALVSSIFIWSVASDRPSAKNNFVLGGFCLIYVPICLNNVLLST